MTLNECAGIMRNRGFRTSASAICDGIESGAYPFGRVTSVGASGRRTVEIYERKFYDWLENPQAAEDERTKEESTMTVILRYFADPMNAAHFSKWCAENLKGGGIL